MTGRKFGLARITLCCLLAMAVSLVNGGWFATMRGATAGETDKLVSEEIVPLDFVPGEIVVRLRGGFTVSQSIDSLKEAGAEEMISPIGSPRGEGAFLFRLRPGLGVEEAVEALKALPQVLYAQPNYLYRATYTPSDTDFHPSQWGLHNTGQIVEGKTGVPDADIDAPQAWELEQGWVSPAIVAVIDTGVDSGHPDLDGQLAPGYNWAGISQRAYNVAWYFGYSSDAQVAAQSIDGTGQSLTHVGIALYKVGNPSENITVSVRNSLNGSDLAYLTIYPWEVSSDPSEIYKPLSNTVQLLAGAHYYLVVRTSNSSSSNYYLLIANSKGYANYTNDPYREGMMFWLVGQSWNYRQEDDFYFHTNPNGNPRDDQGHGTHVSGIIAAENDGRGSVGVDFHARIMPLKALDSSGGGTTAAVTAAVYHAADYGASVINMSLSSAAFDQAFQDAVNYAYARGCILIASAGNDGNGSIRYPAGFANVVGVGATTNRDQRAGFSNYNFSVDLSAPGEYIFSTTPTYPVGLNSYGYSSYYDFLSGTSMSAPMVSGLAALIRSRDPYLSPLQVESLMETYARDLGPLGRDDYFGYGRIEACDTLEHVPPRVTDYHRFDFAEGYTGYGFREYLCLFNYGQSTVPVRVTWMFGDGTAQGERLEVGRTTRSTLGVNQELPEEGEVSMRVESAFEPVVAERPIYFNYTGWTGGHDAMGLTRPQQTFFFAEGYTGSGFQEYLCLLNPQGEGTDVKVTYYYEDGSTQVRSLYLGARTRSTIDVNSQAGSGRAVSVMVESLQQPIVAERPIYFNYSGWAGGHCVMGAVSPSREWIFAEGYTGSNFHEYLCLMNPNQVDAIAHIAYCFTDGTPLERDVPVAKNSRLTLRVNDVVGTGRDVSIKINSDLPIVAERPIYFNYRGCGGGHCVTGYAP